MTDKMYHREKKGKFIDGLSDNNESHQNTLKRKRGNKWDIGTVMFRTNY